MNFFLPKKSLQRKFELKTIVFFCQSHLKSSPKSDPLKMSLHVRINSVEELPDNQIRLYKIMCNVTIIETNEFKRTSQASLPSPSFSGDILSFSADSRKYTVQIDVINFKSKAEQQIIAQATLPIKCLPTNNVAHFKAKITPMNGLTTSPKIDADFHYDITKAKPFKAEKGKLDLEIFRQFKNDAQNQIRAAPIADVSVSHRPVSSSSRAITGLPQPPTPMAELMANPAFDQKLYNSIVQNFASAPDAIVNLFTNDNFVQKSITEYLNNKH